jgi:hypothetical protein
MLYVNNTCVHISADGPLAMDLLLRRGRLSSSLSEQFISALTSSSSGGDGTMPPPAVRAAYRVTVAPSPSPSPGSRGAGVLPVILRHHSLRNVFAVTGFASRGLLYHALTGNFLIRALLDGDLNTIPHNMYIDTI